MSSSKFFALCLLLPAVVSAANDWNTPCHDGYCSFDLHNTTKPGHAAGGSVWITGSTAAISDLTPAAGWTVLNCDPQGNAQSIRAYCSGDNSTCSHLYQNGAVGTIVRLPDNCGRMPFAHITEEWTHDDQSVPDGLPANATVRGITLDTNWHKADARHGKVAVFIQGATGSAGNTTALQAPAGNDVMSRGLWDSIKNEANKAADATKSAVSNAVTAIEQTFSYDKEGSVPISVDKTFNVYSKTAQCSAFSAGLAVNLGAKVDASIDYGLALSGTLIPPNIEDFSIVAGFDANMVGKLELELLANARLDSGQITVFNYGLPGLDFPGILTVGPSFQINTEANVQVTADAALDLDLAYSATGAKLYFPPNGQSTSGTFKPTDSNIQLSANPSVGVSGSISAHVTPMFVFGLSAIDGLASANVNVNVDASATIAASVAKSVTPGGTFGGCFDISTKLAVGAAASGDFFSVFKKGVSLSLYTHTWDLYKKCFGNTRREHARAIPLFAAKRDGLTCDSVTPAPRVSAVSQTVPGSSLSS